MKKIGLVGGTGPESTVMYYKKLNAEMDKLTNGAAMPDIAIESVNFRRAWNYVVQDDFDSLADYLLEKVSALAAGGAEVIALTAVTMHAVYEELERRSGVPLLLNAENCPVQCFDSVEIHLKKLIEEALQ